MAATALRPTRTARRWALPALALGLALGGCSSAQDAATKATLGAEESATQEADGTPSADAEHADHGGHEHAADGGPAPEGIAEAADPTYPVGTDVVLTADHMPGMDGADATVTGAFTTTTYAVTYTPTTGGEPVENHTWVVHEELEDPGEAPLADGTEVVLTAEHMDGMQGALATIDSSTQETVYMVDVEGTDGSTMTNHTWVVESEVQPAS